MTPTPDPDREPSTVDATLDDVRHFYRLMMEGHPSGAALFDAAASDYMANLLDNDADQDGRPDTAELQRLTEQSKRLTAAVPPVPLSPAPQADSDAIYDELLTLARQGCCGERRKPCERHDAYADAIEATLHRLATPAPPSVPTLPAETDEP